MRNASLWLVCLAMGAGCVEQPTANRGPRAVSSEQLEAVRRRVVTRTAPTPQNRLNVRFGNKVELIGFDTSVNPRSGQLRKGQSVTITWYWHCLTPTGEGWRIFTHLDDANGPRTNQDNVGEVRTAYQPERWRAGEYIRDQQTIELPGDWDSPWCACTSGLWKGSERMAPTGAPAINENRARVVEFNTGEQVQVSELNAGRASGPSPPTGVLNEPSWINAVRTGPLVNTMTGAPAGATESRANVRVLWDDQALHLAYEVSDDNLVDPSTARDNHLWENDAVEVMLDPNGDGQNYFEIQVSPNNHTFETRYDRARDPQPFGHTDWNPELRTGVQRTGTVGNADDTDERYVVELAIPWSSLADLPHTPPQVGDQIPPNLFVMDKPNAGGQRFAAWSAPRRGDFHTLERFGRITLTAPPPSRRAPAVVPGPPPGTAPTAAAPVAAQAPASRCRAVSPSPCRPSSTPRASRSMRPSAAPAPPRTDPDPPAAIPPPDATAPPHLRPRADDHSSS